MIINWDNLDEPSMQHSCVVYSSANHKRVVYILEFTSMIIDQEGSNGNNSCQRKTLFELKLHVKKWTCT